MRLVRASKNGMLFDSIDSFHGNKKKTPDSNHERTAVLSGQARR